MDIALRYNPELKGLDVLLDSPRADLLGEDTLVTAVTLSLLCDRTAQAHEVDTAGDRRGWWADAFAQVTAADGAQSDQFGSRLWLLLREKQLPETQRRLRAYMLEALQWLVEDGLATALEVSVFVPRSGWYTADVRVTLRGDNRRYRFEWNGDAQVWRLAGEVQ